MAHFGVNILYSNKTQFCRGPDHQPLPPRQPVRLPFLVSARPATLTPFTVFCVVRAPAQIELPPFSTVTDPALLPAAGVPDVPLPVSWWESPLRRVPLPVPANQSVVLATKRPHGSASSGPMSRIGASEPSSGPVSRIGASEPSSGPVSRIGASEPSSGPVSRHRGHADGVDVPWQLVPCLRINVDVALSNGTPTRQVVRRHAVIAEVHCESPLLLSLTSLPAGEEGVAAAVRAAEIPDADTPSSKRPRRLLPADEPLPPDLQKLVDNCEDISPAERALVAALLREFFDIFANGDEIGLCTWEHGHLREVCTPCCSPLALSAANMDGAQPAEVRVTYCWVNPDGTCGTSVEVINPLPPLRPAGRVIGEVIDEALKAPPARAPVHARLGTLPPPPPARAP
ncbi:putative RNA 2'-phosphotransferase, partial [Frankliniella fusca]